MSKEEKKQYFVPLSVYKTGAKADFNLEKLINERKNGNLSNMKAQTQANQSTDKNKSSPF